VAVNDLHEMMISGTMPSLEQVQAEMARRSLARFVELTSGFTLHPWQVILCDRLQRLKDEKGQRLLIHAPPQVGKSQILSKRFPLWVLGHDRLKRVVIAAYNKTQATSMVSSVKLTSEHEIAKLAFSLVFPKWNDDAGGFTMERLYKADSQPSIIGIGLDSGFTGKGADLLIIDDPYANAEQARSEAMSASVKSFWEETAEPRLMANPEANVVVMFHRYHQNDIAGYLQTRGDWEVLRFPAIADGLGDDPTGREVGEVLSPFLSREGLLRKQEDDPKTFAGQFQGIPVIEGERIFEPWMFEDRFILPEQCPPVKQWFRGIDTATKDKQAADDTATVKMAYTPDGYLVLRGFATAKKSPAGVAEWLGKIIEQDGLHVTTVIEAHNAGYAVAGYMQRKEEFASLVRLQEIGARQGGKRQRAFVLADLAYNRRVYIVKEGEWQKFYDQLLKFTGTSPGEKDDLIDAVTVVTTYLKEQKSAYENDENLYVSPVARLQQFLASSRGRLPRVKGLRSV
jgi:phage terminase large subunit-like protein